VLQAVLLLFMQLALPGDVHIHVHIWILVVSLA
jgi:hypothetical protein